MRAVTRTVVRAEAAAGWLEPRDDLVAERPVDGEPGTFEAAHGPFTRYRRTVTTAPVGGGVGGGDGDDEVEVTDSVDFALAVPYVGFVFALPTRSVLRKPPGERPIRQPWWAPPDRLDPRAAGVLGTLAVAAMISGYLGTLLTQTITFAADEFGAGDGTQGVVLASVRVSAPVALFLVALADRRGRRRILLGVATGGCLLAAAGAFAPTLPVLAACQVGSRACSTSLGLLIGIVAAEEMPRGSRAYAVSLLGMSGGLGAGACLWFLPLADLGPSTWRLVYLVPLVGLLVVRDLARRLPESRRFTAPHARATLSGHGGRLVLLAASAFLLQIFVAPASQFQNEFLREERGFSAARISLFTILTNTPAGAGIIVAGRLADVRGRRLIGAIGVTGGVAATVAQYGAGGWPMWVWSLVGAVVGGMTVPALGVYLPELFPTSLRGRANGIITVVGVTGASAGLLLAGRLSDGFGSLFPALGVLAIGPVLLVVLLLAAYPETASRELEDINPEDRLGEGAPPATSPPPTPRPRPVA